MTGSGPSGDREYVETWEFSTEAPGKVEAMLNQEPCVLNFIEIARSDDTQGWWY